MTTRDHLVRGLSHTGVNLGQPRACLHGGGGPLACEAPDAFPVVASLLFFGRREATTGNASGASQTRGPQAGVHKISHFNVITFTC